MSQAEKKTSIWILLSFALIIAIFIAFIVFLDHSIVQKAQRDAVTEPPPQNTQKPVIDFYSVLPERKVDIPDIEMPVESKNTHTRRRIKKPEGAAHYMMQVGSYQTMRDADRQKARLALLGLEASINSVKVNGVMYYRVQMGPYNGSQYSSVQKRLIDNNVDFLPKKLP